MGSVKMMWERQVLPNVPLLSEGKSEQQIL